ncbi:MAG: hypothetical protein HUU41_05030 [Bryobacteraceae bacterium]|nr:hypothetical protein [Bryobacterales bacterium]NUN00456.1 hypothetical protein [Bryobacteraceae bacterium]
MVKSVDLGISRPVWQRSAWNSHHLCSTAASTHAPAAHHQRHERGKARPIYHFSVDDVFEALIQMSDWEMRAFDHPFFRFLKEMHDRYGINCDVYLFLEGNVGGRKRSLSEITGAYRDEFERATWLRFGPHALNYDVPPYTQAPDEQERTFDRLYSEIERIAGPGKTCDWVRLHFFSEAYEIAPYLRKRGISTLLLTDKQAIAYRLPAAARDRLRTEGMFEYGGLRLRQSQYRIENLAASPAVCRADIEEELDHTAWDSGYLTLFTHEIELSRREVRQRTEECLGYAAARGMQPV